MQRDRLEYVSQSPYFDILFWTLYLHESPNTLHFFKNVLCVWKNPTDSFFLKLSPSTSSVQSWCDIESIPTHPHVWSLYCSVLVFVQVSHYCWLLSGQQVKHPLVNSTAFIGNGQGGGPDKQRLKQLVGVGLASICRSENDSPAINITQDSFIEFISKREKN